jgi:hypothetical protein
VIKQVESAELILKVNNYIIISYIMQYVDGNVSGINIIDANYSMEDLLR